MVVQIKIDVYHSLLTTVDMENILISVLVYFITSTEKISFPLLIGGEHFNERWSTQK